MAILVEVGDAGDPRLNDYTGLTDVSLRSVREPAEGLFLAEGEKVIRRALDSGCTPRSMLMEPRWWPSLQPLVETWDCPVYLAPADVVSRVAGYRVHRGALASFHRLPLRPIEQVVAHARRVVVLEDLVDHTNVGAVFRNAAALGMDAVLVSPRCADPLYRRSVKVSMGSVFAVPWTRAEPWPEALDALSGSGFLTLALSPDPAGTDLRELPAVDRVALVLGTEGEGLSAGALAACALRVRIPMAAGVDSLNVAAASAVACYALGQA